MRKKTISIAVIILSAMFAAFRISGDDILERLGITKDAAGYSILYNITGNSFSLPYAKSAAMVAKGDKVGAAKELCSYIKAYCSSEEFLKAYNKKREENKPTSEPQRYDAQTIKIMKESLASMEKMAKDPNMTSYMDKSALDNMKKQIEDYKLQIEEAEDPTPNKTKWEKQYPADVKILIRKKIEEYLSFVKTVDFNAETTLNKYNKKIFNNPEYERKSTQWKACYRAGKEVNDAVIVFANEWLKELPAAPATKKN